MLTPLQPDIKPKDPKYWTGDIETWDGLKGTKFRESAMYSGKKCYNFTDLDSYMRFMIRTSRTVYFHNLGFDGRFLVKWLIDNKKRYNLDVGIIYSNGLLGILIRYEKKNGKMVHVKVIDSLRLLLMGQSELEKLFLGKQVKKEVDWDKEVSDKEIRERVRSDVKGLWQVLLKFFRDDTRRIRSMESWDIYFTLLSNENISGQFPERTNVQPLLNSWKGIQDIPVFYFGCLSPLRISWW